MGGRRLLFVHQFIATAPNVRSDHEKYDAIKNIDWLHILHGLLPWRRLEWSVPLSGSIECPLELNRQVFGNFRLAEITTPPTLTRQGSFISIRKRIEMLASNVRCHSSSVKDCRVKWRRLESKACKEIEKFFIS